jgi:hypothetical protein
MALDRRHSKQECLTPAQQAAALDTTEHGTLNACSCGVTECIGKQIPGGWANSTGDRLPCSQIPQLLSSQLCPDGCMQSGGTLNALAG